MSPSEETFMKLDGYKLASSWSRKNLVHGGSCIYIKSEVHYEERNDIKQKSIEGTIECTCVEIKSYRLIVICIYRPPQGNIDIFYDSLISILNMLKNKMLKYTVALCGDFNINLFPNNGDANYFKDILNSYKLNQTIFEPTRVTSTTETLIDNIFINKPLCIDGKVIPTALSDHHGQQISIPEASSPVTENKYKHRCFPKQKIQYFKEELLKQNWDDIYLISDADEAYNLFNAIYTNLMFQIFNIKTVTSKKGYNWITMGIRTSCKEKRRMYIKKIKGVITAEAYKKYTKILKKVIILAKKMANEKYLIEASNKTKASWSLVKRITSETSAPSSVVVEELKDNDETPQETLNRINSFFVNACPDIRTNKNVNLKYTNTNNSSIYLYPTDENEVIRTINALKDIKAVGIDQIPTKLLKSTAVIIAKPLTHIINLSLATGLFPLKLKISMVKPIHKKGDKKHIGNYRPISLLPVISKVFEKIIYERLINFLDRYKILTDQQNGFRKKMSTIRAIYQLLSKTLESLNSKQYTTAVLLDLSKAFDSVDYEIMIAKLEQYGIRGPANNLIKSYLYGRKQCVVQNIHEGQVSDMEDIHKGVPQGSILGPLLFILYTNDLPGTIHQHTVMYADDTSILFSENSLINQEAKITETIEALKTWFSENNMVLNVDKTNIINFSYPLIDDKKISVQLQSHNIESKCDASFLGVQLDRRLDWRQHINLLAKKIGQYAYALRIIANTISRSSAKLAYYAYVHSRIQYGMIFWGNSSDVKRIFILQKKCVRDIYNLTQSDSCKPVFIKEQILTLYSVLIIEAVKFIMENKSFFQHCDKQHNYSTRFKENLCPIKPTATYIQKNVYHNIIKIYNKIPSSLKTLNQKFVYKELKNLLLQKAYYSLNEFFEDSIIY